MRHGPSLRCLEKKLGLYFNQVFGDALNSLGSSKMTVEPVKTAHREEINCKLMCD